MKQHEKTIARLTDKQRELFAIVEQYHGEQKRKYTKEPYTRHLLAVADIILNMPVRVPGLVDIALCHDLYEDTDIDPSYLFQELVNIGYPATHVQFVHSGIVALTDQFTHENYPDVNRKERKIREAERLGKIDPLYQTVKYADIIDNTSSIVKQDPGFAKVYMEEIRRVMDVMRGGNIVLKHKCDALIREYFTSH